MIKCELSQKFSFDMNGDIYCNKNFIATQQRTNKIDNKFVVIGRTSGSASFSND